MLCSPKLTKTRRGRNEDDDHSWTSSASPPRTTLCGGEYRGIEAYRQYCMRLNLITLSVFTCRGDQKTDIYCIIGSPGRLIGLLRPAPGLRFSFIGFAQLR